MAETKRELVALSDEVWERIRDRLEGLSDAEYFWEPVPGCWTVRQRDGGSWTADTALPGPDIAPCTTIAWRLWHLIDMYGEDRAPTWLNVAPQGQPIGLDDPDGAPPSNAAEAVALLERAHDRWDAHIELVASDQLDEQVGAVAGPEYEARSRTAYVLHMLDEFIHHGSEIGLLRDLWRWQHGTIHEERLVDRVMRGDADVIDEIDDLSHASGLVEHAAGYARWDLTAALVERGAPVRKTGRTALHLAAGAGELGVVEALVEGGADVGALDPEFNATPAQWAQFLDRHAVVDYFQRHAG